MYDFKQKKAKSNQVKDENLLFPLYSTPQKTHGKMETTDLRPVGKKKKIKTVVLLHSKLTEHIF